MLMSVRCTMLFEGISFSCILHMILLKYEYMSLTTISVCRILDPILSMKTQGFSQPGRKVTGGLSLES
jgi:hypothetical protein